MVTVSVKHSVCDAWAVYFCCLFGWNSHDMAPKTEFSFQIMIAFQKLLQATLMRDTESILLFRLFQWTLSQFKGIFKAPGKNTTYYVP